MLPQQFKLIHWVPLATSKMLQDCKPISQSFNQIEHLNPECLSLICVGRGEGGL